MLADFIVITNPPTPTTTVPNYFTTRGAPPLNGIRNDKELFFTIQPVTRNPPGFQSLFSPDWLDTDVFDVGIGLPDQPAASGTFALSVNSVSTNMTALPFNATALQVQNPLSAAFVLAGYAAATVTALPGGLGFEVVGAANGAVPTGKLTGSATYLQPACDMIISEVSLGDASSPYQYSIIIRQSPVAYAVPSTALVAAAPSVTTITAGSGSANKVQQIVYSQPGVYGGGFTVAVTSAANSTVTCGVATPNMTIDAFGALLTANPDIRYNTTGSANNIIVGIANDGTYIVTFIGNQGLSNVPTLIVSNSTLESPQGVSGMIALNTISLYRYSLTQTTSVFAMQISIKRTRATGESQTIQLAPISISKDIIDTSSMIPVDLPSYYTQAQSNARFLQIGAVNSVATDPDLSSDGGGTMTAVGVIAASLTTTGCLLNQDGSGYFASGSFAVASDGGLTISDSTNLGATLTSWKTALGISSATPAPDGTYASPTSITIVDGIITAIS